MTHDNAGLLQRFLTWARFIVPTVAATLVMLQWWQNSLLMDEARTANQAMRQIWTDHPPAFPIDTLSAALYVPMAVSPLGAFDSGDGPWLAQSVWLQVSKIARAQDQLGFDIFSAGRQISLSAATFAQIAIPCLALVLGWRQALRNKSLSLQSWTSMQIALIEYAAPMVATSCLLTALLQRQSLGAEGATRLMLILGSYVLYSIATGTICWLAFMTSSSISRATGLLVLFWLFNITLARPLTVNLAATVFPPPNLEQYARRVEFEIKNGYNGVESHDDRQRRFIKEILRGYKANSPADVPVNVSALVLQKEERHHREVSARIKGEVDDIFLKQERLEQVLSMVFPLVAVQISSSALSATDFASQRRQLADAEQFWDQIAKKVYYDVAVSSGPQGLRVQRGSDYWRQIPFYEPAVPSPFWALFACLMPSCGLLLFGFAGLLTSFRKPIPPVEQGDAAV